MHGGARTELRWLNVAWARCEAPFREERGLLSLALMLSTVEHVIGAIARSVTCEAPKPRSAKTAPPGPALQQNDGRAGEIRSAGEAGPKAAALAPTLSVGNRRKNANSVPDQLPDPVRGSDPSGPALHRNGVPTGVDRIETTTGPNNAAVALHF